MSADFFISYTGKDRAWAEWIAWVLVEANYTIRIQAWDFLPGCDFVQEMQKALLECKRVIAALSPAYPQSKFGAAEWHAAFRKDPLGEDRLLVPVRVGDCNPEELLAIRVYIDLVGVDEAAAQEKLLNSIKSLVTGARLIPATRPSFPGADQPPTAAKRPPFPGTQTQREFVHNLPFSPNPFFTGREQLLKDLHEALHRQTAAAITQPQAVHGLGGVGKTHLAVEYAWANRADYDAILWVGAAAATDLHANVARLATVLRLPQADAREQEARVAAVLDWLQSHRRWLLILDNADTPEAQQAVGALLPPGLPGHVIVTWRRGGWPLAYADLEVRVLAPEAAEKFLLERTEKARCHAGPASEARAVASDLGCLPLALEQAAAYLVHQRVTFAEYRRRLAASRAQVLKFPSPGGTGYQQTVATTWLVTEAQLAPRVRAVLQLAALLAPDEIPRAMFTEGGKVIEEAMKLLLKAGSAETASANGGTRATTRESSLPPREERAGSEPERGAAETEPLLSPALSSIPNGSEGGRSADAGDGADVDAAVAELAGYSLIELEAESFTVHRLLQAVLHDRLGPEARRGWVELAVELVNEFAPEKPEDVRAWPVWDRVRPHATAILREAGDQANPTAATLMNELGMLLMTKALHAEAEPLLRRALAIDEQSFGPEHPTAAIRLNNLAQLLQATNRLAEAEPLMRRALAMDEQSFGPEHPSVAIRLNNLARLLHDTNRLAEAEPLMRRALAIDEQSFGPEHPNVARDLNNLAALLQDTNRLAEAEPLIRRALAIDEQSFGPEHPDVARDLNNLAQLLQDTNRLAEAEPLLRRALAIDEQSLGPEHPNVATDLNNLALLLQATDRLAEAEPLMRRAVEILLKFTKATGHQHPHLQMFIANYSGLLSEMGRSEAEVQAQLNALGQPYGLLPGGPSEPENNPV